MLLRYHAEPVTSSMKGLLCLEEKQIDFASHYVNLLTVEQHADEFVTLNPNRRVAVLVDDGAIVAGPAVIDEYLEDVFPETPPRQANPVWREKMRTISTVVAEYLCPALSMIGWPVMVRRVARSPAGAPETLRVYGG